MNTNSSVTDYTRISAAPVRPMLTSAESSGLSHTEERFHSALAYEIHRSERSRRPFVLILVTVNRVLDSVRGGHSSVARRRASALRLLSGVLDSCTRESDIKGWYQTDVVMGAICIDVEPESKNKIAEKVLAGLASAFEAEAARSVTIVAFAFPDDEDHIRILARRPGATGAVDTVIGTVAQFSKRLVDIAGGLAGILLFSPFFLTIPLLIRATSHGPALFRQKRVGQGGRLFSFLKFRTMYTGNDSAIHRAFTAKLIHGAEQCGEDGKVIYKIENDPRVTKLGRILRKTSLDEIPQFFNVLMGNMSLVGPRPALPYEVEEYEPWHRQRLTRTKPGITGYWQVEGRSSSTFGSMVRMDIRYAKHRSLLWDLKLILRTPFALSKGAR